MRLVVQIILISILVGTIAYGEYFIFWKKSEYTAPQAGTVIDTYESSGKNSSTCFATVAFDNGDRDHVNTGHHCYSVGDRFVGSLSWTPFTGVCGTAYSWSPSGYITFLSLVAGMFNILLCIGFVIFIFVYAFGSKESNDE